MCFDELVMKVMFNVIIVYDFDLIVILNMFVYYNEVIDGWKYDYFEKLVVMFIYLVVFVVCDFKYIEFILIKDGKMVCY